MTWYGPGGVGLGWHSDDEPIFGGPEDKKRILSFSMGSSAMFEIRTALGVGGEGYKTRVKLNSGDLCDMSGHMQTHYEHRITRQMTEKSPR
eukprot:5524506-Karenia_brevis.AAC.1